MVWTREETRPRIRRMKDRKLYHLGDEEDETKEDMDGLCQPRHESYRETKDEVNDITG